MKTNPRIPAFLQSTPRSSAESTLAERISPTRGTPVPKEGGAPWPHEDAVGQGSAARPPPASSTPPSPPPSSPPPTSPTPTHAATPADPSGQDAYTQALQRLSHGVQSLRLHMAAVSEAARSDALDLAVQMARAILQREIESEPGAMLALVQTAVKKTGNATGVTVRLHPQDLTRVQSAMDTMEQHDLPMADLNLVGDATLEQGDVVVQGEFGQVDGRLNTRLTELRDALASQLQNAPP
jgi:hypothetical protein